MATYFAKMLDAETGGEGSYSFEGPDDLMQRTADEIVTAFFAAVEPQVLKYNVDWEINGIMKNRERRVVTAIGSLIPERDEPDMPFLLMISDRR